MGHNSDQCNIYKINRAVHTVNDVDRHKRLINGTTPTLLAID